MAAIARESQRAIPDKWLIWRDEFSGVNLNAISVNVRLCPARGHGAISSATRQKHPSFGIGACVADFVDLGSMTGLARVCGPSVARSDRPL